MEDLVELTGQVPPALAAKPEFDWTDYQWLLTAFHLLSRSRGVGPGGMPNPLAVADAVAYHHAVLGYGGQKVEHFLKLLFAMDEAYLTWQVDRAKQRKEADGD